MANTFGCVLDPTSTGTRGRAWSIRRFRKMQLPPQIIWDLLIDAKVVSVSPSMR